MPILLIPTKLLSLCIVCHDECVINNSFDNKYFLTKICSSNIGYAQTMGGVQIFPCEEREQWNDFPVGFCLHFIYKNFFVKAIQHGGHDVEYT